MAVSNLALVLFLKNEAADVVSWLAWHAAMGCETFIIYDDHSTDGTWDIINQASKHLDIRACQTDQSTTSFTVRQMHSYLDALSRFGSEFEWMGFIDSDEFISTDDNEILGSFLAQFPDAHAVALNWCNYGSNGHALRPSIPIIEAFTRHSRKDSLINRHVKTILRTSKFRGQFRNVHYFDVDDDFYVDSAGRTINWSVTKGITATEPDWLGAKIMHFQCRSMEHFVERLKLRTDVPPTTDTWRHYDLNDEEDTTIRPLLGTFHQYHKMLRDAVNSAVISRTGLSLPDDARSVGDRDYAAVVDWTQRGESQVFFIKTTHDTYVSCSDGDHRVRHRAAAQVDGHAIVAAVLIIPPALSFVAVLYLPKQGSWIDEESRRGMLLAYNVVYYGDGRVHLQNPATKKIMCATPLVGADKDRGGHITLNREHADEWEKMTLVQVSQAPVPTPYVPEVRNVPATIPSADDFMSWLRKHRIEDVQPVLDVVLHAMSPDQRRILNKRPGLENLR